VAIKRQHFRVNFRVGDKQGPVSLVNLNFTWSLQLKFPRSYGF